MDFLTAKYSKFATQRVLIIAFGSHSIKAVLFEGTLSKGMTATRFILQEIAPVASGSINDLQQQVALQMRNLRQAVGASVKQAVLILKTSDAILRYLEMPAVSVALLRKMLHKDAKKILQDDLKDYNFDCYPLHYSFETTQKREPQYGRIELEPIESKPLPYLPRSKMKFTLVGGVQRELLDLYVDSARDVGFKVDLVLPNQFAQAQTLGHLSQATPGQAVVSVDMGLKQTTICLLREGELIQSRVVHFGGENLTHGVADSMKIAYEAAESVKVLLPNKVQLIIKELLLPLVAEIKGSIDFFEAQFESKVAAVFFSGGAARSSEIIQQIEKALQLPCKVWEPDPSLKVQLSGKEENDYKRECAQLAPIFGALKSWLAPGTSIINLLVTRLEEEKHQRRDPLRIGFVICLVLIACMLVCIGILERKKSVQNKNNQAYKQRFESLNTNYLNRYQMKLEDAFNERAALVASLIQKSNQISFLNPKINDRFLVGSMLNALQHCVVDAVITTNVIDGVERISVQEGVAITKIDTEKTSIEIMVPSIADKKVKEPKTIDLMILTIQLKDFADPGATDRFLDKLSANPYFKNRFYFPQGATLKQRSARQADTSNPKRNFTLVTVECILKELREP